MDLNGRNVISGYDEVEKVVEYARDYAFDETKLDLREIYRREKNRIFIRENNIRNGEIKGILSRLRIEEYAYTSIQDGEPDAYAFGVKLDALDVYLKFQIVNGIIMISFHEPERQLNFPYRMKGNVD